MHNKQNYRLILYDFQPHNAENILERTLITQAQLYNEPFKFIQEEVLPMLTIFFLFL